MGEQEDIELFENKMMRLKILYEQYFMRILKREPLKQREDVERVIMRYSNVPINNTALKYKFGNLVARYNSYKQYWTRILIKIEAGTYTRRAESVTGTRISSGVPVVELTPEPESARASSGGNSNSGRDGALKGIYDNYIEARKKCNEPTKGLTFEKMKKSLAAQKKKVGSDVDLKVSIQDGKAKISMVPKK